MKMNPLRALLRINWSSRGMRIFDIVLAFAALGYGLYEGSELLIWVGAAAVALSLINPMGRIQRGLNRLVRPRGVR
jgi:hypothetical protein